MKVLHIGLMVNGRGEGLSEAFRKACDDYREVGVDNSTFGKVDDIYLEGFSPDIVFCQIQNDKIGEMPVSHLNQWLTFFKERGAKVINWTGDVIDNTPGWMRSFNSDVVAFSNMRDVNAIAGSKFLQIGIDPKTFKYWEGGEGHDVVFMGNNYGSKFPLGGLRQQVANWVAQRGAVYGNYEGSTGNLQANPNEPFPQQSAEAKIYSASKIAISVSHYNIERYTSDRLLRAMGSHCFTLAYNYPGIEKDFEIGKHLDVFNDLRELDQKVNHYLVADVERERIARAGYTLIHTTHTYDNMVQNIFKL